MVFLCSKVLGEGAGIDFGRPGGPPRMDFERILGHSLRRFGRSWHPSVVPTSSHVCSNSRSVVVLPSVPCHRCLASVGRPSVEGAVVPRSV